MDFSKALRDWTALNDALRTCTEAEAVTLLKNEQRGKKRRVFVLRIYTRFKRLRDARERDELLKKL